MSLEDRELAGEETEAFQILELGSRPCSSALGCVG